MKFFDPKVDMAFKKLFGSEDHTRVTIAFLNTILKFTGDQQIQSIVFNNNEQLPEKEDKKEHILDVFCTDKAGRKFIIEMQNSRMIAFDKRIVYYGTRAYSNQLPKAAPYDQLQPVAVIAITKKFILYNNDRYKSVQQIMDIETYEQVFKDLTFVIIELPKFNKKEHELVTDEDKWLFLIKEIENYNHIPTPLKEDVFQEACGLLNTMTWSETEQEVYIKRLFDAQNEEAKDALLSKAEQREKEAEQREQEALERGQKQKALEIAKNMRAMGIDIKTIVQITKLTEEEIDFLL